MQDKRTKKRVAASSVEEALIDGLTELRDTMRAGKLETKFTMRTVDLQLEPREYDAQDVKAVRAKLGASQSVFAQLLGVRPKTVMSWEQGLVPPPMARRLLELVNENPERWRKILRDAAKAHAGT